jgi:hypothetical protein
MYRSRSSIVMVLGALRCIAIHVDQPGHPVGGAHGIGYRFGLAVADLPVGVGGWCRLR